MTQTRAHVITQYLVKVEGSDLDDALMALLVEVTVDDHRWLPDAVELRFRDHELVVVDDASLEVGKKLRVGVQSGDSPEWLADVEITSIEMMYDEGGTWTVVRGYDASHRLQRGRSARAFVKMNVADIFTKVVQGAGAPVGSVESGPVLEEVIQPNISDWEFLNRLARDFGLEVVVDRGKVGLCKPVSASAGEEMTLTLGESIHSLRVAVSAAEQVRDVQVRSWDPKQKQVVVGKADASTTVAAIGSSMEPKKMAAAFGNRTLTVTDVPYVAEQGKLTTMAKGFADQVGATFVDLEVVIDGHARAQSGKVVKLDGVGTRFGGKYVVTSARHVLGPDGYTTTLSVSGRRDTSLRGLVGSSTGSGGSVLGLVPAIVTDILDPDKKGRVKVKLPWLADDIQTDWSRTVQMGGGKGGGMVIPEVDDEVLVGFEQGRLECPYVIGGLYNGKDGPGAGAVADVDSSSGAVSRRSFADREGNRVELIKAGSGDTGVRVTTGDGKFSMYFDGKNQTIQLASAGKVEIAGDSDISLVAKGNASIEAAGNLTLKATGNIKAEATGNFDAKATGNMTAEGMATTVKGQTAVSVQGAMAELKGSAATTITGGIVKIN